MSTELSSSRGEAAGRPVVFPALRAPGEAEGFTRGHAAGYAAGLRRAEAEARRLRAEQEAEHTAMMAAGRERMGHAAAILDTAARALADRVAPVLAAADGQLASAAVELAEAVIAHELTDAPWGAKAALERALSGRDAADAVAVRLHPDDLAVLEGARAEGGLERTTTTAVALVPDASLGRGDAVAVYLDGELDARIASALSRAANELDSRVSPQPTQARGPAGEDA